MEAEETHGLGYERVDDDPNVAVLLATMGPIVFRDVRANRIPIDDDRPSPWLALLFQPMPSAISGSLIVDEDLFDLQVEQPG
jgi:hypothetical protein